MSSLLLILAVILTALSAATLIPWTSPVVSYLGYHTLCPFAPWSSLALLFFAWVAWEIRKHINSQAA